MRPLPFPLPLNIGTDVVHIPRIFRLISRRGGYLDRFTRRILCDQEEQDFRARFNLCLLPPDLTARLERPPLTTPSPEMARWLAGRFAAKEAARKAAPDGAASVGWKDVLVRVAEESDKTLKGSTRPEIVYLAEKGGRVGKLSISHDGDYVIATVLAAS